MYDENNSDIDIDKEYANEEEGDEIVECGACGFMSTRAEVIRHRQTEPQDENEAARHLTKYRNEWYASDVKERSLNVEFVISRLQLQMKWRSTE